MTLNYLSTLEDPHHPVLGPTLWGLRTFIMCPSNKGKFRIIQTMLHLLAIFMVISQYIELYFIGKNLELALNNLSLTFVTIVSVVKIFTFITWNNDWMSLINYVSSLEKYQLEERDQVTNDHIKRYTNYSRTVTSFYWILVFASIVIYFLLPLTYFLFSLYISKTINIEETPYPQIISSWVPFDNTKGCGYWIATLILIFMAFYITFAFAIYDANIFVLITFFYGQLQILKSNCERLFDNGEEIISYEEVNGKIKMFHHHHVSLVKYFNILNSLLSPVMFFYIILCSLTICASAVQLSTDEATLMVKLKVAEYLVFQVFQLFLFCWHSHKVLDMSFKVDEGIYSSAWWSQDKRLRRSFILLSGQLNKAMLFTAGPFVNLNLVTFIAILKGAYSYYMLLSTLDI